MSPQPRQPPPELVVVDIETTGLDPDDRIIEVAALKVDERLRLVDTFATLVDPGVPLPLAAERRTGVTAADLEGAPPFAEVYPAFLEFVGTAPLVGHNIDAFDLPRLSAEARSAGLVPPASGTIDTLQAALLLFPELDRHALPVLADHLGLARPTHRARRDAEVTLAVFETLCRRAAGLAETERRLLEAAHFAPLMALDAYGLPPGQAPPSLVAGDDRRSREQPTPLVALPCRADDWVSDLASPDGLAARLDGFCERPGQKALADEVATVLARGGIAVFEAGTGMGKSLAYLLPAAFSSAARGARVVVATKTKALQRQLAAHELPLVEAALPPGWRWSLLMGRENYLCRRLVDEVAADAAARLDEPDRCLALAYLIGRARWGEVDLSALPYRAGEVLPALKSVAREVRSAAATCPGRRCPARAGCHWRLARARAEAAHLVVVNHALLLTGEHVLPPHDDLIIDEAHLLRDEALSAYGDEADWATVEGLVAQLLPRRRQPPLAARLRRAASGAEPARGTLLRAAADACERAARDLPGLSRGLAASLDRLALVATPDEEHDETYAMSLWLTPGLREQPAWDGFATASALLAEASSALAVAASAALEALPDDHRERVALLGVAGDAERLADLLTELPDLDDRDTVTWAELPARNGRRHDRSTDHGAPRWKLARSPLTPATRLREALWERVRSAVLTSATLTVAGSFDYTREALGLSHDLDVSQAVFPSPFDYRDQAALILADDPGWRAPSAELPPLQAEQLTRLTEATGGRLLALFTNRRHMELVARTVGARAESDGVLVLAQGVHGSAAALADEFRSHPATVLLGVDTLWTGQDFPGDVLVCLAIAKLPFGRQDPLCRARRRAAEEEGRDWFSSFYLPEAILRFRQGFGRLIRTETDHGVVVVLDPRLPQKRYLRELLASLPELDVLRAAPDDVPAVAAQRLKLFEGKPDRT